MAEITMSNTSAGEVGLGEVGPIIAAKWDMVLDAATMVGAADPAAADQIPARLCWLRTQILLLCAEPSRSHADVLKKYCTMTFVFRYEGLGLYLTMTMIEAAVNADLDRFGMTSDEFMAKYY